MHDISEPNAATASDHRALAAAAASRPPRPRSIRPIFIVGAGGIVRAAHLPAYQKAGFPVAALTDTEPERAEQVAREHRVPRAFRSVPALTRFAPPDAVYDVAVPASQLPDILRQLPRGAAVLMQKPMGDTLAEARVIRDLCREREFTAAVNFSFRYSPNNLAARAIAEDGLLGAIHDIEVQVRTYTPWQLWGFLATAPRLEILYHSIHYIDLVRSWLGEPESVRALTLKNPTTPELAATRSSLLLDYGPWKRVFILTNHAHTFGPAHQASYMQVEGTAGAVRLTFGMNLDYPYGMPDALEFMERGNCRSTWTAIPIEGNTVPDGFLGTMGALQAYLDGSIRELPSNYEDAFRTMAVVEACYRSSDAAGEPIPQH